MSRPIAVNDTVVCTETGVGKHGYGVFPVAGQRYIVTARSGSSIYLLPESGKWEIGVNHTGSNIEGRKGSCDFQDDHFMVAGSLLLTKEQKEAIALEWAKALDIEL